MQKITTYLWFDNQAEEAANFYTSVFKNSRVLEVSRYGEGAALPAGTAMTVRYELDGQEFIALNGGPQFKFTEAISLYVDCGDQAEVDYFWDRLVDGGEPSQCGWLKDRYGLSWQIIPRELPALLTDPDPEKAQRALQAMFTMSKIDIEAIRKAHQG
ncbi:MAG TPA: VOC family protein [Jiangellaceae bacterium]|nr:VOC family protein [Jiangellaceae bacterium]